MGEPKQTIAKLFVAFADALNSMDDREFDLLIHGKAKLRLVETQKNVRKPLDEKNAAEGISALAQKLNDAESREVAESLLASINYPRRRDALLLLAKTCNVSVGSKDSIARIEQKIIEDVVGTKLRAQAIKNVAF